MWVPYSCMTCLQIDGRPNLDDMVAVPITDSGIIRYTCGKGHKTVAVVQQLRFELLSEIGKNAIIDGYNREGVVSFAGALERLQEFYCLVVWRSQKLDTEGALKSLRLSERQLGAFVATHLMVEKTAPILLSSSESKFRNDVVHNGYIPTRDEAIGFGQRVIELCYPTINRLKANHLQTLQEFGNEQVRKVLAELKPGMPNSTTISLGTPLSLVAAASEPPPSLQATIDRETDMVRHFRRVAN